MKTRSQDNEHKWTQHLHKIANKENQQEQIQQPYSNNENNEGEKAMQLNSLTTRHAKYIMHPVYTIS